MEAAGPPAPTSAQSQSATAGKGKAALCLEMERGLCPNRGVAVTVSAPCRRRGMDGAGTPPAHLLLRPLRPPSSEFLRFVVISFLPQITPCVLNLCSFSQPGPLLCKFQGP